MDTHIPILEILLRLLVAVGLGAALGLEREIRKKPAGLRTYTMVSLGSASFTLMTIEFAHQMMELVDRSTADPIRIIAGIVGGIGFLGAGTIIQSRGSVEGVTTAAGIWVVGAIGIAAGAGGYVIALLTLAFALAVLTCLGIVRGVAHWIKGKGSRE